MSVPPVNAADVLRTVVYCPEGYSACDGYFDGAIARLQAEFPGQRIILELDGTLTAATPRPDAVVVAAMESVISEAKWVYLNPGNDEFHSDLGAAINELDRLIDSGAVLPATPEAPDMEQVKCLWCDGTGERADEVLHRRWDCPQCLSAGHVYHTPAGS